MPTHSLSLRMFFLLFEASMLGCITALGGPGGQIGADDTTLTFSLSLSLFPSVSLCVSDYARVSCSCHRHRRRHHHRGPVTTVRDDDSRIAGAVYKQTKKQTKRLGNERGTRRPTDRPTDQPASDCPANFRWKLSLRFPLSAVLFLLVLSCHSL